MGNTTAILSAVRAAAAQYGRAGDRSLECVSITVNEGTFRMPAVYRLYQQDPGQAPIDLPPELQRLTRRLGLTHPTPAARISDISRTDGGDWRMCIKLRTRAGATGEGAVLYQRLDCPVTPDPVTVDGVLRAALCTEDGTLVQMGTELRDGCPHTLKTYWSLRTGDLRYGRFPPPAALMPAVTAVWQACGGAGEVLDGDTAASLTGMGYHPFLLGLNQRGASAELKLYHMLYPYRRHAHRLQALSDEALAVMGIPAPALTAGLDAAGLYLRGLARWCTLAEQGWKLYFSEKEEE